MNQLSDSVVFIIIIFLFMKNTLPLLGLVATVMLAGCQTQAPVTTDTSTKTPVTQSSQEATTKASLEIKPAGETTEVASSSGREQFGSQISPDGKWLLSEKHEDYPNANDDTIITHQLIAKSLDGQGEKILFTMKEQNKVNEKGELVEVPGVRFSSDWTPAGWSKDGKKAYYAVTPKTEGLGGWYPNSNINFEKIMEVDVETQTDKEVFNPKTGFILSGVADFDAATQRALSTDKDSKAVTLTDLKTGKTEEVYNTADKMMPKDDGISSALFDPTGKKVAVVTYANPSDEASADAPAFRDYKLFIIDLTTMEAKMIPQKDAGEFELLNWVNETSVKIHKMSPVGENDILVSVD